MRKINVPVDDQAFRKGLRHHRSASKRPGIRSFQPKFPVENALSDVMAPLKPHKKQTKVPLQPDIPTRHPSCKCPENKDLSEPNATGAPIEPAKFPACDPVEPIFPNGINHLARQNPQNHSSCAKL